MLREYLGNKQMSPLKAQATDEWFHYQVLNINFYGIIS